MSEHLAELVALWLVFTTTRYLQRFRQSAQAETSSSESNLSRGGSKVWTNLTVADLGMTEPKPYVLHESAATFEQWDDHRGHVSFRTTGGGSGCSNGTFTSGTSDLQPGGWLAPHRHEPAELYYVLEGTGIVTLGDDDRVMSQGDTVFIPGNCRHGVRNNGDGVLRVFYTFAVPHFEDVVYRFD